MGPVLALVFLLGGILLAYILISRKQRFQPAQVDARGNVLPVMDIVDRTFTDMDRSPNYHGSISNDVLVRLLALLLEKKFGLKPALPDITAGRQDKTTENDQMIDLATRGLLPDTAADARKRKEQAGQQAMQQLTAPTMQSRYRLLDGASGSNLDVIDGQIIQGLDIDWKEARSR